MRTKHCTYVYICSGGEQEYLAYEYPNPKQLISFVFLIMVGVFARGAGLAQVKQHAMHSSY